MTVDADKSELQLPCSHWSMLCALESFQSEVAPLRITGVRDWRQRRVNREQKLCSVFLLLLVCDVCEEEKTGSRMLLNVSTLGGA